MMNRSVKWAAVLLLLILAACSDESTGVTRVDRVDLDPSDVEVVVGDSVELTAVARSASGAVVEGAVLWRSLHPSVATVRASGASAVVIAHATGVARIEAESGGRTGYVDVMVEAPLVVGSVDVLPQMLVLEVGEQHSLEAEVKSTTGVVMSGVAVTWEVEPAGAVTLTPQANGRVLVTGQQAGEAAIRAVVDGAAGQAFVQVAAVLPPPQPIAAVIISPGSFSLPINHETTLQAIAQKADGTVVSGRPVTWEITSSTIAQLNPIPASPFAGFTAKTAGTVTVRATIDGVTGETTIQVTTVTPPPQQVFYLMFDSPRRGIWRGNIVDFSHELTAIGANGRIDDPQVTWSIDDPSIAELDGNGKVRGLVSGTTTLRAKSGDREAQLRITVFEGMGPVATFDLTWDWWDGQWHMSPIVGTETWTDENGGTHNVSLYVTGGSLELHSNGNYERRLVKEGWADVGGAARKVITREAVDVGTTSIIVGGETGYWMHSSTTPGLAYKVVPGYNAGHLLMRAPVGTAPEQTYMFRMRQ